MLWVSLWLDSWGCDSLGNDTWHDHLHWPDIHPRFQRYEKLDPYKLTWWGVRRQRTEKIEKVCKENQFHDQIFRYNKN
jgi:hypothetical protein